MFAIPCSGSVQGPELNSWKALSLPQVSARTVLRVCSSIDWSSRITQIDLWVCHENLTLEQQREDRTELGAALIMCSYSHNFIHLDGLALHLQGTDKRMLLGPAKMALATWIFLSTSLTMAAWKMCKFSPWTFNAAVDVNAEGSWHNLLEGGACLLVGVTLLLLRTKKLPLLAALSFCDVQQVVDFLLPNSPYSISQPTPVFEKVAPKVNNPKSYKHCPQVCCQRVDCRPSTNTELKQCSLSISKLRYASFPREFEKPCWE